MKKRKGFTLVELLVVIAIIALLMGILMPALAKVRAIAYRMVCGANMAGLGKAMLAYANENNEYYPISGKPGKNTWSTQGAIAVWHELNQGDAFMTTMPTITSSEYLLSRTQEVTPKQFVCKGDVSTKVFTVKDGSPAPPPTAKVKLENCWDFGGNGNWPGRYCSYAYHMPFCHMLVYKPEPPVGRAYPIVSSSASGSPILADRNPYNDKNADSYIDGKLPNEKPPEWIDIDNQAQPPIPAHYSDPFRSGNSACHQREGQNVLFNDNSARFEKYPNVGIDNDHIYKYWGTLSDPTDQQKQLVTTKPVASSGGYTDGKGGPYCERDAYLVIEDNRRQPTAQ